MNLTLGNSGVTWLVVATWAVTLGNAIIPVVPPLVAAVIASIISIITLVTHNNQIKAGAVKSS
jgi:CHASE2 domain-containing sensor protein